MDKKCDKSTELEAARKKIPPDQYPEYMKLVDLQNVLLVGLSSKRFDVPADGALSYSLDEKATVLEIGNLSASIAFEYTMKAKASRRRIAEVKAQYVVVFHLSGEVPREFFILYNAYSLSLQTYPYLRECIHSLFPKMGLPPLVLPLRKFLIGK